MAAYMKPVRTADVARAVPLDGRGQRSAQTMLSINEREALLRDAADRFCVGMSDRQAAAMLHAKLARYRAGAFRRDRSEPPCPARHRGTITEFLWKVLKVHHRLVSERLIMIDAVALTRLFVAHAM
jgi:hypothetical protein